MAFESGGIADKLGNRYESRWVAKQLLNLLNEDILSVSVELIGPDEQGVDLLIVKKDGTRQLQQCKARLGSKVSWSIADLKNKGILDDLKHHLDRDPQQEFALVSAIPAQNFADICESARISNDNPDDYLKYQIQGTGSVRRKNFIEFCKAMGLIPEERDDLIQAIDYFKRTYIELYPDDHTTWSDLLTWTGFLLTGKPEAAISILLTYIANRNNYRKQIYADELGRYLAENHQIYSNRFENDPRITTVVKELQNQFFDSIRPLLILNRVIKRKETCELIESLNKMQDVVIHGAAGNGKSGVLYELTEYLIKNNIPFLPVRLDRRIPNKTAKKFGEDMDLPGSPAYALAGLAVERKCVLILDQMDSIRWTAAHSAIAMDVCKELLRQVRSLRQTGKQILIVFACRTYDLESDPEIKSLINDSESFIKIFVSEFSNEQLEECIGPDIGIFTDSQKRILSCPQNLVIWMQLKQDGMQPEFRSATELMRRFWENRRQILERNMGISPSQLNDFLNPLLSLMELEGNSAPLSLVEQNPSIRDALISSGILHKSMLKISFCHQNYLDYLIAERLLHRIYCGTGSVLEWLGPKIKQSLFRREQLRQILALLADESKSKFYTTTKQIMGATDVRFHLKHLVLEMFGQLHEIKEDMGEYCLNLFRDDYWQEHVFETVFLRHTPWVSYLNKEITDWISSSEEKLISRGLWLLRSVADQIPDNVIDILSPFVNKGAYWESHILNTICSRESNDSERMFELRLNLAKMGHLKEFVDWTTLSERYPMRSIRLIEAIISTWQIDGNSSFCKEGRSEILYNDDLIPLKDVAQKYPAQTWDLLMPHVKKLTINICDICEPLIEKWQKERSDNSSMNIARGVVELLILAGQTLAVEQPDELIARTYPLEDSDSIIIQEIILAVYTNLPATHADTGMEWLVSNLGRLRIGSSYNEPEWIPASRLLKALSAHCGDDLFQKVEQSIVNYHDPEEKQTARYYLKGWRHGHFGYYFGEAQFFMLPCLDTSRMQPATGNLISVLKRRFDDYPNERFLRGGVTTGGWMGSKLDKNLQKISDISWLNIIESKRVKQNNNKWIRYNSDLFLETSIHQFARSLSQIARQYPERFGRLTLKFPDNVHISYVSAVLDGFNKNEPGEEVPQSERGAWQPASIDIIETVLDKYRDVDDREFAMSFCRLIKERADEKWSDNTIKQLIHYACNHPDLEIGTLNVNRDKNFDEATVETLFQNTVNCVRGSAAAAIGSLLWEQKERLVDVRTGIESLVGDLHSVVRMAGLEAIEPVLDIDRDLAVQWFCMACENDLRVAASPLALRFYNSVIPCYIDQVELIIKQMASSSLDDVAREGTRQVAARFMLNGLFEKEFDDCLRGSLIQRKGVANVAASLLNKKDYSIKCQKILERLMNDPDKEVRDESRIMLQNKGWLIEGDFAEFIKTYIKSLAFPDNPDLLIWHLKDFPGNLIAFADTIFTICEEFSKIQKEKTSLGGFKYSHITSDLSSILLRLYEQAQNQNNRQIPNRCLDIWDLFFENRIGGINELTKAIEQ